MKTKLHTIGYAVVLSTALACTVQANDRSGVAQLPTDGYGDPSRIDFQHTNFRAVNRAKSQGLLEPALNYKSGKIAELAKITGLLHIKTKADANVACTSAAISKQYIITNAHCVPQSGPNQPTSMIFYAGYLDARRRTSNIGLREFLIAASSMIAAPALAQAEPAESKQPVCIFTKPFNSLSFDELADQIAELGVDGIEAPIRAGGHVQPEQVQDKLPELNITTYVK